MFNELVWGHEEGTIIDLSEHIHLCVMFGYMLSEDFMDGVYIP